MLKLLKKILKVGVITEKIVIDKNDPTATITTEVGELCKKIIAAKFNGSLAIRHVDAGSCNGCELEIHALNNAYYDIERFGIHFVASPRHADILLVTGPVTQNMKEALLTAYNATPNPKLVVAVGDCGAGFGEFSCGPSCIGTISKIIPVDLVIKGCPPTPLDLLRGLLKLLAKPNNKYF